MKIGIIGSRQVLDNDVINISLQSVIHPLEDNCVPLTFVGGASKGCERIVMEWVQDNGYDYVLIKPYNFVDTSIPHHPRHFIYRNKIIIDNSDAVIVFLHEEEKGVQRSADYLKNLTSKPYVVFQPSGIKLETRGEFCPEPYRCTSESPSLETEAS